MARKIEYQIGFSADTSQLQTALKQAATALQGIGKDSSNQLTANLRQASQAALELEQHLHNAYSIETGGLDLSKFQASLAASGMTLEQYGARLRELGPTGEQAFLRVAQAIAQAELPIRRSSALLDKLWITMKNTLRWQLTSGMLHGFVGSVQTAYSYAQSLNESLNSIRIVTQKSVEDMDRFAVKANEAAQNLSTTTTRYTDAALIYYQQGLTDQEVEDRTEVTIKLANAAGEAAQTASEQLTAVWNNFYDGSKSLEYYADVMTALGASTASSTQEISTGLQKFAAVADTVGLSYEYAAAALATVTATTRESADIVGTAFRTLFGRLESLKLGETLDDGTTLNKYSLALKSVGVDVKDVNGNLKDMDIILDETMVKWQTLTRDQQMALAQTVAGVRQYSQFIALMDNADFFRQNLETAREAEGALQEQAGVFAESWEAASNRLRASAEDIYSSLINDKGFIQFINGLSVALNRVDDLIEGLGGLGGVVSALGTIVTTVYGDRIANSIRDMIYNVGVLTGAEEERTIALKRQISELLSDYNYTDNPYGGDGTNAITEAYRQQLNLQIDLHQAMKGATEEQQAQLNIAKQIVDFTTEQVIKTGQVVEELGNQVREAEQLLRVSSQQSEYGFSQERFNQLNTQTRSRLHDRFSYFGLSDANITLDFLTRYETEIEQVIRLERERRALETDIFNINRRGTAGSVEDTKRLEEQLQQVNTELANILQNRSMDQYSKEINQIIADLTVHLQTSFNLPQEATVNFNNKLRELIGTLFQLNDQTEQNAEAHRRAEEAIRKRTQANDDLATSITKIGQSIAQASMAFNAMTSFTDTLGNANISGIEKFTRSLTSIGFVLPVLIRHLPNLATITAEFAKGITTGLAALGPWMVIIAAGLGLVIGVYKNFGNTAENMAKKVEAANQKYEEASKAVEEYEKKLSDAEERIEELQKLADQGTISVVEQEELANLEKQNELLKEEIELRKEAQLLARKEALETSLNNPGKEYKDFLSGKGYSPSVSSIDWKQSSDAIRDYLNNSGLVNEERTVALGLLDEIESSDSIEDVEEAGKRLVNVLGLTIDKARELGLVSSESIRQYQSQIIDQWKQAQDEFKEVVELGYDTSSEAFQTAYKNKQEADRLFYGEDSSEYFQKVLDPAMESMGELQVRASELQAAFSDTGDPLYKSIEQAAMRSGVSIDKLKERYESVFNEVSGSLENVMPGLSGMIEDLNYTELLKLQGVLSSFDGSADDLYKKIYAISKETENLITKSIEATAAARDALDMIAKGNLLDETHIKKIKEAYAEIGREIPDFSQMVVPEQIDALQNLVEYNHDLFVKQFDNISQAKEEIVEIGNVEERLAKVQAQVLETANEIDKGGASEALESSLKQLKQLEEVELGKKFKKLELEVDVKKAEDTLDDFLDYFADQEITLGVNLETDDIHNGVAEIVNIRKALKLIGDDLKVQGDDVAELAQRAPELLVNAHNDAAQGIMILDNQVYENYKARVGDRAEIARAESLEELQERYNTTAAVFTLLDSVVNKEQENNSISLSDLVDTEDQKKGIYRSAIVTMIQEKIRQSIQEQEKNVEMANSTDNSTKAMVDSTKTNYPIMVENAQQAASKTAEAFKRAFQNISKGISNWTKNPFAEIGDGSWAAGIFSGTGEYSGGEETDLSSINAVSDTAKKALDTLKAALMAVNGTLMDEADQLKNTQQLIDFMEAKGISGIELATTLNSEITSLGIDSIKITGAGGFTADNIMSGMISSLTEFAGSFNSEDAFREWAKKNKDYISSALPTLQELMKAYGLDIEELLSPDVDKSKKKGGSGSNQQLQEEKKELKEVEERYHEINREIKQQEELLKKLDTQIDRTYGIKRLDLYEQSIKELGNQIEKQNRKLSDWNTKYYKQDRAELERLFAGYEIQFGNNDEILNYTNLLDQIYAKRNEAAEAYNAWLKKNKGSTNYDKDEKKRLEVELKDADTLLADQEKILSKYEETLDTRREIQEAIDELNRQIEDRKLSEITFKMELILDVKNIKAQVRDFMKDIASSYGDALTSTLDSAMRRGVASLMTDNARAEMEMLQHYTTEYNQLRQRMAEANEYTNTDDIKQAMAELVDNITDSGEALLEWIDYWENMVPEAMNAARERFEQFTDQLSHNTSVLDTIKELYALQGQTYKTTEGFNRLQRVARERMEAQVADAKLNRKWYEEAEQLLQRAQSEFDNFLTNGGTEQDVEYDYLKNARDAFLAEFNEAQEAYLSSAKDAMETARDMYLEQIDRTMYEFDQMVSNGMGLDLLQQKFDHYIDLESLYYDPVNEAYETASWYNKLQEDIDKVTTAQARNRLKALQEEIDLRRESGTLSKYDLDILEAKYKLLQAQLALEDAQNNMTQLRLVRDSQGNWNYQYTNDPEQVAQAEQQILDAQNERYNIAKERTKEVIDEMLQLYQDFKEQAAQIDKDVINGVISPDEGKARLEELQGFYEEKFSILEAEKNVAIQDMDEAAAESLIQTAMASESVYQTSSDTIKDLIDGFKEAGITRYEILSADLAGIQGIIDSNRNTFVKNENLLDETLKGILNGEIKLYDAFATRYGVDLDNMVGSSEQFEYALDKTIQKSEDHFKNFGDTIYDVADETDTKLYELDETVNQVSDSTELLEERGWNAADALWEQEAAAYDAAEGYRELARAIEEAVREMSQLAAAQATDIERYSGISIGPDLNGNSHVTDYSGLYGMAMARGDTAMAQAILNERQANWSNLTAGWSDADKEKYSNENLERTFREETDWSKKIYEAIRENGEVDREYYDFSQRHGIQIASGDTGMYTGSWGSTNGKLAVLHEKELVLNQTDTANILSAVNMMRSIDFAAIGRTLDNNGLAAMGLLTSRLGGYIPSIPAMNDNLEQDIHIEAVFPSVTSSSEIEDALMGLANDAAQYARIRKS